MSDLYYFVVKYRGTWREDILVEANNPEEAIRKIKNNEEFADTLESEQLSKEEVLDIQYLEG